MTIEEIKDNFQAQADTFQAEIDRMAEDPLDADLQRVLDADSDSFDRLKDIAEENRDHWLAKKSKLEV